MAHGMAWGCWISRKFPTLSLAHFPKYKTIGCRIFYHDCMMCDDIRRSFRLFLGTHTLGLSCLSCKSFLYTSLIINGYWVLPDKTTSWYSWLLRTKSERKTKNRQCKTEKDTWKPCLNHWISATRQRKTSKTSIFKAFWKKKFGQKEPPLPGNIPKNGGLL